MYYTISVFSLDTSQAKFCQIILSLFLSIVELATERKVCPILMTGIGSFQEGNVLDYDSKSGTVHLELTIESLKKAQGKTAVLCVIVVWLYEQGQETTTATPVKQN